MLLVIAFGNVANKFTNHRISTTIVSRPFTAISTNNDKVNHNKIIVNNGLLVLR